MCNCSEHESGSAKVPVTSAGPAMKPLVPLSRQIRISDDGAGDAPPSPIPGPVPPIRKGIRSAAMSSET